MYYLKLTNAQRRGNNEPRHKVVNYLLRILSQCQPQYCSSCLCLSSATFPLSHVPLPSDVSPFTPDPATSIWPAIISFPSPELPRPSLHLRLSPSYQPRSIVPVSICLMPVSSGHCCICTWSVPVLFLLPVLHLPDLLSVYHLPALSLQICFVRLETAFLILTLACLTIL